MIRTLIADADLLVKANPSLFELILINVLDNAIPDSADGTRIVIAATRVGERCRISIADEGCGIPGADSLVCSNASIASAGRRLRPRQRPRFAIAKGFVEAPEGSIAAYAPGVDDRGTTIEIMLPLASEQVPL